MKRFLLIIVAALVAFLIAIAAIVWFAINTVSQIEPASAFLEAPLVGPQMSGPTGLTPASLVRGMRTAGSTVAWERSDNDQLWILHMGTKDSATGAPFDYVVRMAFIADGRRAGIAQGPAVVVTELSGNGVYLSAAQVHEVLNQVAGNLSSSR